MNELITVVGSQKQDCLKIYIYRDVQKVFGH